MPRLDGTAVPVLIRAVKMEAEATVAVPAVDMAATKHEGVEDRSQLRISTLMSGVSMVEKQEQEPVVVLMRVDTVGVNPRPDIRCRMPTPCPIK